VRDELAIARASGKPIFPIWVAGTEWTDCVPMGMGYTQFIDVRDDKYANGLQQIIAALSGQTVKLDTQETEALQDESETQVDTSQPPRNPYKGLRAFQAKDRNDFFGREDFVNELIITLRDGTEPPRFLCVVGASGSGKSSVAMAGLLPALQNGAIHGSENWIYLEPFVPGELPIENLTAALWAFLPQMPFDTIQENLNSPTTKGLHRLAQQIIKQGNQRLVLYIDQFEELFTLTATEEAAAAAGGRPVDCGERWAGGFRRLHSGVRHARRSGRGDAGS
jgi:hypothetical protein